MRGHGILYVRANLVTPALPRSLPTDLRIELEGVIAEVTAWGNAQAEAINQEARSRVIASGRSEVVEMTNEQISDWQAAMAPVWDQFSEEIGVERIDAARALQRDR